MISLLARNKKEYQKTTCFLENVSSDENSATIEITLETTSEDTASIIAEELAKHFLVKNSNESISTRNVVTLED